MRNSLLSILSLCFLLVSLQSNAQAPQMFNYQGVARDNGGTVITNQNIGLQISILAGSNVGTAVFEETHSVTTNNFGLFNIMIGSGTVVSGILADVDWGAEAYWIKVALDASGGTSYQEMGTSQLLSVPYALYSNSSAGSLNDAYQNGRSVDAVQGAVKIEGEDGLLVTGTFGSGTDIEISGEGTRMFFNPKKAAFRAGGVNAGQWNDGNVGEYSVAFGIGSRASGYASTASGLSCVASGQSSVSLGRNSTASGAFSVALGYFARATETSSTAIGADSDATGAVSTVIGEGLVASGERSMAFGIYNEAYSFRETVLGSYCESYTPANTTGWNSTDRLLVVGNGSGSGSRSNALTILKNGNTGIGTTSPVAKLHVVDGDVIIDRNSDGTGGSRTLTLSGRRTGNANSFVGLEFRNEDSYEYLGSAIRSYNESGFESGDLRFYVRDDAANPLAEGLRLTHNAEVYVPEADAGIIMKSSDGNCWKLTVSNAGAPVFTSVTCP